MKEIRYISYTDAQIKMDTFLMQDVIFICLKQNSQKTKKQKKSVFYLLFAANMLQLDFYFCFLDIIRTLNDANIRNAFKQIISLWTVFFF